KILEFKDDLVLSKKLIQLVRDVPIDVEIRELKAGKPDVAAARELFLQLEFYSILNEYLSNCADRGAKYEVIQSKDALNALVSKLSESKLFSICCETDSGSSISSNLIGISLSTDLKGGAYVPLAHSQFMGGDQLEPRYVLDVLKPVLENPSIEKAAYNLKHQILVLRKRGINLRGGKYDPMLMSYVLNPTRHGHKLEDIAKEYLHYQTRELKALVGTGQKQIPTAQVGIPELGEYCCEKTDLVLEITALLQRDLERDGL